MVEDDLMEKTQKEDIIMSESEYIVFDRCDIMNALVDINSSQETDYTNLKVLLNEILNNIIYQEAKEQTFLSSIHIKRNASKHLIRYMKDRKIACYD